MGKSLLSAARSARLVALLLTIGCQETTVPAPVPAKLAFLTMHPASTVANAILPALNVAVQDANGNVLASATNSITLSIGTNPAQGKLSGTTTVAAIDGVATFSGLSIDKAGTGFTLTASSPKLSSAITSSFSVVAGAPTKLVFTVQPATTLARTPISPFTVSVQDNAGNAVPLSGINIGVRIWTNPGGAQLLGGPTQRVTNVTGSATFSNLTISNPGTRYTLTAFPVISNSGLATAISSEFDQTVGTAVKIELTEQPLLTRPGEVIPAVVAAVQDSLGNIIRTATPSMTIAIGANSGNASLTGTTTITAVNGLATFSDLKIAKTGTGYTLVVSGPGLASVTSNAFSVRNPLVFATVSAGYFHSCGVTTTDDVYCWGVNSTGQLGNSTNVQASTAEPTSGGLKFGAVGAGRDHNCGTTAAGVAYCWGSNDAGQLGSIGSESRVPAAVTGSLVFANAIGGYDHSCGVTTAGAGYCWGGNSLGALGNGTVTSANTPTAVSGGLTFASISPGRGFTCGLTTARAGYCWGDNSSGFLGDGTVIRRDSPVVVSGQLEFASISAGGFFSCGLTTAGRVFCWGANSLGQLGDGSTTGRTVPGPVSGALSFTMLSVGNRHACALTSSGAAYCWGDNTNGNLGIGSGQFSQVPIAVAGGLTFANISAGRFHTCGVTTSGAAYCWGENSSNQLGDGTYINKQVPVAVR
jgi:alpha-tubulin suppressor-like RCC1 family protein